MTHTAYVHAIKHEGGHKVWHMTTIELTDAEYAKFFTDEVIETELHACHIVTGVDGQHYWDCSCGVTGNATSKTDATEQHRQHKYEEMGSHD